MSIKKLLEHIEPANQTLADSLSAEHKLELLELVEIYNTDPDYVRKKTWRQLAKFFGQRWGHPNMRGETLKRSVERINGDQETLGQ